VFTECNEFIGIDTTSERRAEMYAQLRLGPADRGKNGHGRQFAFAASQLCPAEDLTESELRKSVG
jgi:hypothetical protein